MKVLVITDSRETGGVEQHTLACLEELNRRGHSARLMTPGVPALAPFLTSASGFLKRSPVPFHLERPCQIRQAACLAHALISCAEAVLMEVHSTLSCYYPLWLATLLKRPVVLVQQLIDPECALDSLTRWRRQKHLRACHKVVAVARCVTRGLSHVFGLEPDKIVQISNGTPVREPISQRTRSQARARWGLRPEDVVIVSAARLAPQKRIDTLLETLAMLRRERPEICAIIAGDGPLAARLRQQAQALGLGHRVRFTGHLKDVRQVLAAGDVFVLSSSNEGLPIAVLEAMAAGLCVVATACGGTPEAVIHGKTGFLVSKPNAAALARGLQRALDLKTETLHLMGERGRQRISQHYSLKPNIKRVVDLLEDVY